MPSIADVLTGVAALSIRQPNDSLAAWSTAQRYAGDRSVKLYKGGSGNAGSTHVELSGLTSRGITLAAFDADPTDYSFWHHASAVVGNFGQFELRFEDPNSDAWVEVTVADMQGYTGTGGWVQNALQLTDVIGFGGVDETGLSFFDWDLSSTIADAVTDIDATTVDSCADWILERVRIELWEAEPERTMYVDSIEIDGTVYTIEPGGTAPALSLSSAFTLIGYTEDGVTVEYAAETAEILVEEETFPVDEVITKETATVTLNMAETSLANLDYAMAGSLLSGSVIELGGGATKYLNLKIESTDQSSLIQAIHIPKAVATGTVGLSYKKGEKTMIPITLKALKSDNDPAVVIVKNAA